MSLSIKLALFILISGILHLPNMLHIKSYECVFISCARAEAKSNYGYDIGFTAPFNKVFLDEPRGFNGKMIKQASIAMAKNEYEATQMVIFPEHDVEGISITVTDLIHSNSESLISKNDIEVNVIGYVNLIWPEVGKSRAGWHPDPLLPNHTFDLKKNVLRPILITVKTSSSTASGKYAGQIKIKSKSGKVTIIPFQVKVWNFEIPKTGKFKSSSLASWDITREPWPVKSGYKWPDKEQQKQRFLEIAELGFKNRLPPVFRLANGLNSSNWRDNGFTTYGFPVYKKTKDGKKVLDVEKTDQLIDYMLSKGANHFVIAITSDIYKYPDLAKQREETLITYLKGYTEYLRKRGLLDMTYVYNVDEPWGKAVENAKKIYRLIKKEVGEDVRIMQNVNQNNGRILGTFLNHFDAIDINLGFYDITKSDEYRKKYPDKFKDFWWNVNLWPRDRPNLFIEYPLVDARIIGPMSYKYNVTGFEYWELFVSRGLVGYHPIAHDEFMVDWKIHKGSLDGVLIYPADGYKVYSSLRFESFRDGIEDVEYLYLLEKLSPGNALLKVPIVRNITQYSEDQVEILNYREKLGELLDKLASKRH